MLLLNVSGIIFYCSWNHCLKLTPRIYYETKSTRLTKSLYLYGVFCLIDNCEWNFIRLVTAVLWIKAIWCDIFSTSALLALALHLWRYRHQCQWIPSLKTFAAKSKQQAVEGVYVSFLQRKLTPWISSSVSKCNSVRGPLYMNPIKLACQSSTYKGRLSWLTSFRYVHDVCFQISIRII